MPVPKYYEMQKPFLLCLQDGQPKTNKEIYNYIKAHFCLTDEDISELLPSGRETTFKNRASWASTYLKKAGLIIAPARAVFQITAEGSNVLREDPDIIDKDFLLRYESFQSFQGTVSSNPPSSTSGTDNIEKTDTPDDILDDAMQRINASLADDLMVEVMKLSPTAFEKMVLDLMNKMGYGTFSNAAKTTATTGDEGIDGIIMQDKLGFDLIYVQTKQYAPDNVVGRPAIQAFVGAIAGRGGKGLFVTTSKFSKQAIDYAASQHIILIDGKKLTDLMIEYDFGVNPRKTFFIKTLDTDIFAEYQDD